MKRCHWVKPKLVCQVKFTEWTRDDRLRQPVFLGIREDKSPTEVVQGAEESFLRMGHFDRLDTK
jgi:bifunctional non-homologous end joining protein LigD